jgi:hypothetical protein
MLQLIIVLIDLAGVGGLWWLYSIQPGPLRKYYWPALLLRVLAGLAVGWLYFFHYGTGDTVSYWHDGTLIAEKIKSDPVGTLNFYFEDSPLFRQGLINEMPRALFFIKISGLVALLGGSNYWVMATIVSGISFLGAWYMFIKSSFYFPRFRWAAAVAFLFYPSTVFWSSGLIKESLGLGALFFLAGAFLSLVKLEKLRGWEWVIGLAALWIGWTLKYYWLGVFMPVALTAVIVAYLKNRKQDLGRLDLALWAGVFLLLLAFATSVHPNFYPHRFLEVIWQSHEEFMALTSPENAVRYTDLQPSFSSIIRNVPLALFSGLFRPLIFEQHNLLSLLAGIENLGLLVFVLTSLPYLVRVPKAPNRLLTMSVLVLVVVLSVFLALSTPNLGTLSRYKIGFLPFLVYIVLQNNYIVKWIYDEE